MHINFNFFRHKCVHLGDTESKIVDRIIQLILLNIGSNDTNTQLGAAALANLAAKKQYYR